MDTRCAIAIGAHPDDIEFYMAGTLLLLGCAGWQTHYLTLANGCGGSVQYNARQTAKIRRVEARRAAGILGAHFHGSLCNDLEIFYNLDLLRRLAAIIREVKPGIVLTHSPVDYMEDHTNTSRLAVTAAFTHAMPNFRSLPPRAVAEYDVAIYHSMPHSLQDPLRRPVQAAAFVNTTSVHQTKLEALRQHQSQQNWLEVSQGMTSYLQKMEAMSRHAGRLSGRFKHAEGWQRHLHYGFSQADIDPLKSVLRTDYLNREKRSRAPKKG